MQPILASREPGNPVRHRIPKPNSASVLAELTTLANQYPAG
jgi:hypothetical protein